MNIAKVFSPRADTPSEPRAQVRPESDARADGAVHGARSQHSERQPRTEPSVGRDRVRRRNSETVHATLPGNPAAQFASMLALLARLDAPLPDQAITPGSPDGELLDELISHLPDSPAEPVAVGIASLPATPADDHSLADSLQYRLRRGAGTLTDATAIDAPAVDALAAARNPRHARLSEVFGRIVTRRGTSVEELMARGDHETAGLLTSLDSILAHAGMPVGRELVNTVDRATLEAGLHALTKAVAASANDVTMPVREVEGLAPALKERLDRVVDRMKSEYGHDVSVVETVRSPERQNFLYEQGRTRPGAVVTWTRDSAHLSGEAVDVLVDGSWNNAQGFGRLQRIAQEEGLRTLGVRDPGHLELPREARRSPVNGELSPPTQAVPPMPRQLANEPGATGASQSGVARVAGVAQMAAVARVANAGGAPRVESSARATAATTSSSPTATEGTTAASATALRGEKDRTSDERSSRDGQPRSNESSAVTSPVPGVAPTSATDTSMAADVGADPAAGARSAERVFEAQRLRDDAPAGPLSRLELKIDAPDGGQDRITVDLRGSSVSTRISTDTTSADRLRLKTASLQDSLGRHGLESESVRISGANRMDGADTARAVAGDRDGLRLSSAQQGAPGDGATQQGQRERAANAREWDRPESSRQSRDEQRESSRRGPGQRGQPDTHNRSER